ncbi:MAG TPA: hypothetical protein VMT11_09035 [Myxococcaceae bacterium]|nr:hypothetical protein [Myxococcaceae bacterium]
MPLTARAIAAPLVGLLLACTTGSVKPPAGLTGGNSPGTPEPPPGQAALTVTISPRTAPLVPNGSVSFSAVVGGTSAGQAATVTWSVQESGGGAVDASGRYTAPAAPGTYHVVATSTADPSRSDSALITVGTSAILPPDRLTIWNPGLNAVGGIPARTTVYRTLAPSGGDDTSAIQTALDGCPSGQVVKLGPGTFKISGDGLSIGRSGVVLRGSGPGQTILMKSGSSFPVIIVGLRWYKYSAPVALASNGVKGSATVTVAANPGFKVGEIVHLSQVSDDDQRNDTDAPVRKIWWGNNAGGPTSDARGWFCEQNRPLGQAMEIAQVNGTQLTFTTPFHIDFETVLSAHILRISDTAGGDAVEVVKYSGIEDLAVANGDGGDGGGNIHFFAAAYSWVRNVESWGSLGHSCNLDGSFRCEVRDSYFHSTRDPNPGGNGYGIGVNQYAADNLFENNVVWAFNKLTVARASGGGNVFGYNYLQDGYGDGYRDFVEVGAGPNHYAGAHMELFEGNEGFNYDTESYWGNSIYGTVFRNHWTGLRRSAAPLQLNDTGNRRAVGVQTAGWWFSFLGNVLGFPNMPLRSGQTHFVTQMNVNNLNDDSAVPMWIIGYDTVTWPTKADPLVVARTYRHGNFDYVSNAVAWDPSNPNHDLPPSLYLSRKPAFFGSNTWPWIDPAAATDPARVGTLPAKVRFDAIHGSGP